MPDLSILIPARNEEFLSRTVEDILAHIEGDTEIIVVLDGALADPGISDHDRVRIIYNAESIGQRAATNQAARLSQAKYLMKVDAHCSFDQGFDVKMMADMQDDWTMVPTMRNLHAFDWVCPKGHRRYQSPSGVCKELDCGLETIKEMAWTPRGGTSNSSYCFDAEPHFQYFGDFNKRPEGQGDIVPTMSLQGSCFMITREKYWSLNICDEEFGSWGSQGIEVACKTWLSGGQVMVNKKTWYAHMFRTQGGDFSFPYPQSQRGVEKAKERARQLFFTRTFKGQVKPLSWLIEKFWPIVNGDKIFWDEENLKQLKESEGMKALSKGIIYYTDNQLNVRIAKKVQKTLEGIGLPIVSTSLKPMPNFGNNIHIQEKRGYLTMFKQILAALEASTADIIFFCEHDVLYPKEHFDFIPTRKDTFYYDTNVYKLRDDGKALWVDDCRQVSGICVFRETAIAHYKERVAFVEAEGFNRNLGFEPGTHKRHQWEFECHSENWLSSVPMIDIRHDNNLTPNRWSKDQFRDQRNTRGWKFVDKVVGWDLQELAKVFRSQQ